MKTFLTVCFLFLIGSANAFQVGPSNKVGVKASHEAFQVVDVIEKTKTSAAVKILPAFAALTAASSASAEVQEMSASYLPAIMTPLVGLVFPAFSMALFFLLTQKDDLDGVV